MMIYMASFSRGAQAAPTVYSAVDSGMPAISAGKLGLRVSGMVRTPAMLNRPFSIQTENGWQAPMMGRPVGIAINLAMVSDLDSQRQLDICGSHREFSEFGNLTTENDEGLYHKLRLGTERRRSRWKHKRPS